MFEKRDISVPRDPEKNGVQLARTGNQKIDVPDVWMNLCSRLLTRCSSFNGLNSTK
uniref:Lfe117p1 n=1 Tax=Leptospirillum ferrooxidans TaxID=180 RepID=Q7X1L6_9BACT|nr:Lfe117p1 [Leptospirillum ferrooxidans]